MKILVVDDEPLICRYITQCIRDSESGDEVVGVVSSGKAALKLLEGTPADLALVDITMPKMNGLELLGEIKTRYPAISVVILTCHEEFEYARAAMQNEADNYVLKSELTAEHMKEILNGVRNIRKKKGVGQLAGHLTQSNYLKKIVAGGSNVYVITEETLRKNNILLRDDAFLALCFQNTTHNLDTVVGATETEFENPLLYTYSEDLAILLLNVRQRKKKWDTFDALFQEMAAYFERLEPELDGKLGYSRVFFRMARLRVAISEALETFNSKFYEAPLSCQTGYGERVEKLQQMMMRVAVRMEEGNFSESSRLLREVAAFAGSDHPDAETLRRDLLQSCGVLHSHCQADCGACERRIRSAENFRQLKEGIDALAELHRGLSRKYSHPIQQAVDFIHQNYAEDLTLNAVADHVFLNREYLSRQFKKEVGMKFSEYLNSLRLRRARELLETTNLRIFEVAAQVGIPNISYFSTVFRKEFHRSPTDVRAAKEPGNF